MVHMSDMTKYMECIPYRSDINIHIIVVYMTLKKQRSTFSTFPDESALTATATLQLTRKV